jgi:hypothetical protein
MGWGRWTGSLLSRAGPGFVESIRPDDRGNLWKASRGLAGLEVGQAQLGGNVVERPRGGEGSARPSWRSFGPDRTKRAALEAHDTAQQDSG